MIVDIRTYNVVPRRMKAYLAAFEQLGLPILRKHLGEPLGYFVIEHGELNQVVHLWGYDSLAEMERLREVRNADPAWDEYLASTDGMLISQSNKIGRPAAWSGIR